MAITINSFTTDSTGKDFGQYETNDAVVSSTQTTFVPQEKEAGRLIINYNAVNTATGAASDRVKMMRYKCVSGVISLIGPTNVYSNSDATMTSVDPTVVAVGDTIVVKVVGVAGQTIRHTMTVEKLSSQVLD